MREPPKDAVFADRIERAKVGQWLWYLHDGGRTPTIIVHATKAAVTVEAPDAGPGGFPLPDKFRRSTGMPFTERRRTSHCALYDTRRYETHLRLLRLARAGWRLQTFRTINPDEIEAVYAAVNTHYPLDSLPV